MTKNYYANLTPEAKKRKIENTKRNYEKRKKENYALGLRADGQVRKARPKMTPEESAKKIKESQLKYRNKFIAKGLTASGLERRIPDYFFSTGKTLKEWQGLLKNGEIEYKDLPEKIKAVIWDPAVPKLKPSKVRDETGLTLEEWGKKYNITREAVRQLKNKWGTINDELMMNRGKSGGAPYWKVTTNPSSMEYRTNMMLQITLVKIVSRDPRFRWVKTIEDVCLISDGTLATIYSMGPKKINLLRKIENDKNIEGEKKYG